MNLLSVMVDQLQEKEREVFMDTTQLSVHALPQDCVEAEETAKVTRWLLK